MSRLTKLAVIVGHGPGLGSAVADAFAEEGFGLALVARNPEKLARAVESYSKHGTDARCFSADIADASSLSDALDRLRQDVGDPEVLIYNAAAWRAGPVLALSPESLEADFRVCVSGALAAARALAPAMVAAGRGTILFTGGGLALHPSPSAPSLSIGKAGLRALASMLAQELTPQGVKVATITVAGSIADSTPFAPSRIAAAFMTAHRSQTAPELLFDGKGPTGFQLR